MPISTLPAPTRASSPSSSTAMRRAAVNSCPWTVMVIPRGSTTAASSSCHHSPGTPANSRGFSSSQFTETAASHPKGRVNHCSHPARQMPKSSVKRLLVELGRSGVSLGVVVVGFMSVIDFLLKKLLAGGGTSRVFCGEVGVDRRGSADPGCGRLQDPQGHVGGVASYPYSRGGHARGIRAHGAADPRGMIDQIDAQIIQ